MKSVHVLHENIDSINRCLGVRANSINRLLAAGEQTSTLHILPALSTSRAENAGPLLLLLLHRVHPLPRLYLFLCDCSCDIPSLDNLLLYVSCQPVNSWMYAVFEYIADHSADSCSTSIATNRITTSVNNTAHHVGSSFRVPIRRRCDCGCF